MGTRRFFPFEISKQITIVTKERNNCFGFLLLFHDRSYIFSNPEKKQFEYFEVLLHKLLIFELINVRFFDFR